MRDSRRATPTKSSQNTLLEIPTQVFLCMPQNDYHVDIRADSGTVTLHLGLGLGLGLCAALR